MRFITALIIDTAVKDDKVMQVFNSKPTWKGFVSQLIFIEILTISNLKKAT